MNPISKICALAIVILSSMNTLAWPQEAGDSGDKTLSPYFFVKSDDPGTDALPLKSTSAAVDIAGVIADVRVTQVYKNEGKRPIEAIYVFPASTRAAVYGMTMTIGKRTITAEIKKRDDARTIYEQARQEGRSASLLEQQRPNVFQMNVANIMPGDTIKVVLSYTELLVPEEGEYEFVYPTVVGPRYSTLQEDKAPQSEQWLRNPYLHEGDAPPYTFDMSVDISAGLPIQEISCPSHKVSTNYEGRSLASIRLDATEKNGGNRDFILKYRLTGKKIESGLLLYKGEKENFFLLTVQPPERVTTSQIPGREYIFIVDVSGSMHGFPLEISKKLLKDLISSLRSSDKFNVLLFSGGSMVLSEESLPATSGNIGNAINFIERQRGGGGTELLPALQRALSLPRAEGYSRTVIIATDGYVGVEAEAFELIRKSLGQANMFAFGIGSSVNRHLIEGMARAGMGEPFIVTKPDEASAKAEALRKMVQSPVLTGIKAGFGSFNAYDVEPPSVPDVLAERPVIIFGKWRGSLDGPNAKIIISGISGNGNHRSIIDVAGTQPTETNSALRYLWARHRIATLSDFTQLRHDDEAVKEVTNLGLTYNLLTAYTSFVAADTEVRNRGGEQTTIKQPLPLPQGVSDYAVGGAMAKAALAPSAPYMAAEVPAAMQRAASDMSSFEKRQANKEAERKDEKSIKIDKVVVSGGLTESAVQKTIKANIDDLKACAAKDGLRGKVVIKFIIAPDGTIKNAQVVVNEIRGSNAKKCIMEKVKAWSFPGAQGKTESEATVILVFPG